MIKKISTIHIGLIFIIIFFITSLLKGESILINYHDQLDSEVVFYKLKGRSLADFTSNSFPEFMDSKAKVTVPSVFTSLIYLIFTPNKAFIINLFFARIIAFCSLFFLLGKSHVSKWISLLVALTFALLPFYSVYGISIVGIPLVILAFWNLHDNKHQLISYLFLGFYALYSSLVLVGFAVIFFSIIFMIVSRNRNIKQKLFGFFTLISLYGLTNLPLINSILFEESFISHRESWVFSSESFITKTFTLFLNGQNHITTFHHRIIPFTIFILILLILNRKKNENKLNLLFSKYIIFCLLIITLITLFYGVFETSIGLSIRRYIFGYSPFYSFQFDRIYWILPFIWYFLFALELSTLEKTLSSLNLKSRKLILFSVWLIVSFPALRASDITTNFLFNYELGKPINGSWVSWESFYSENLFSELKEYLNEQNTNEPYKVASIGLYPSITLFNGFSCVDGYSNNYSLTYKKQIIDIQKQELEKNQINKSYLINWGNRAYIFSSQLGKKFYFTEKDNKSININLNADGLIEIGCSYIISAVKINNSDDIGLNLLKIFTDIKSPYIIYVYKVENT